MCRSPRRAPAPRVDRVDVHDRPPHPESRLTIPEGSTPCGIVTRHESLVPARTQRSPFTHSFVPINRHPRFVDARDGRTPRTDRRAMGSSGSESSEDASHAAASTAAARSLADALAPIFASLAEQCLAAHEAMCAIAERAPTTTLARRRKGKRDDDEEGDKKLTKKQKREMRAPRQPTAFNLFMKAEVTRVRAERPGLGPKEVFTECAARWKAKKAAESGGGGDGGRGSLAGVSTPAPVKEKKHKEKSHKKEKKHRDK